MTASEAHAMVIDPDERVPARVKLIEQIVDTLQEAREDWYAEPDTESSIALSTPLGKFNLVVVEENE